MAFSYAHRTRRRLPPLLGARSIEAAHRVVDLVNAHPALWPVLEQLTRTAQIDWPRSGIDWPHVLRCIKQHLKARP